MGATWPIKNMFSFAVEREKLEIWLISNSSYHQRCIQSHVNQALTILAKELFYMFDRVLNTSLTRVIIHLSITLSNQWICLTICVNQQSRVLLSYRKKVTINDKYNIYGHCVKSVQIWSFFWFVFSFIRTEYGLRFSRSANHGHVTDWGGMLTISYCKPIRSFTTIIIT